jgi:hypothetical protein
VAKRKPLPDEPEHGEYVGPPPNREIDGGKVSKRRFRWFSYDWWFGHHMERNRAGEWKDEGASDSLVSYHRTTREQAAGTYRDYLRARRDQADDATNGVLLSREGQRRGVDPRRFFDPRRRPPARKYASEELRTWLDEHGDNLTSSEWWEQTQEREEDTPTWGLYSWR